MSTLANSSVKELEHEQAPLLDGSQHPPSASASSAAAGAGMKRSEVVIPIEAIPELGGDESEEAVDLKSLYLDFLTTHFPILSVLMVSILAAYMIGRYHWSWLWLLLLAYGAWFIGRRRVEQFEAYHANRVDRVLAKRRLPLAPESCEWINHILERFWAVFEPVMSAQVIDRVNSILKHSKPSFVSSLELSEFTLGSAAPAILGAQVYPHVTDADNVHLDLEASFVPNEHSLPEQYLPAHQRGFLWNSKVVLTAKVMGIAIPVQLSGIMFHGTLRVHVQLAPNVPFIKRIQVCFLRDPDMDFVLKPLGGVDIMDLPGLSNWLFGTIRTVLRSQLVHPNKFIIDVAEILAEKHKSDEHMSIGVARITVLQVRGVKNPVGTMVRLSIGGKFKGTTDRLKEAAWNEVFYVLVNTLAYPLTFALQGPASSLMSASSETFGSCKVSLDDPADLGNKGWRPLTLRSNKAKFGRAELKLAVDYFPTLESLEEAIAGTMVGGEKAAVPKSVDLLVRKSSAGVLHLIVHGAKELPKHRKKAGHQWSSFVEVRVDCALSKDAERKQLEAEYDFYYKRTVVKKKTNTPTWEQHFEFLLGNVTTDLVSLCLRDAKEDVDLGHVEGSVLDLLRQGSAWHTLQGVDSGKVYLSFFYNPVSIPGGIVPAGQTLFVPAQALCRLRVKKLRHLADKGKLLPGRSLDLYVQVFVNDARVGETKHVPGEEIALQETFDIALKAPDEDELVLAVMADVVGKDECLGKVHVKLPAPKQTASLEHPLEKDWQLMYAVTHYPLDKDFDRAQASKLPGNQSIIPEPTPASNCGLLFLDAVVLEGLAKTGMMHRENQKLKLQPELYVTTQSPSRLRPLTSNQGTFKWTDGLELFVQDYSKDQLHLLVWECSEDLLGSSESLLVSVKIPVKTLKRRLWYPLYDYDTGKPRDKGRIYVEGCFRPIDAKLSPRPLNVEGTLSLKVRSASNLVAVDSGGTSDPYVQIVLNDKKLDKKTKVVKKNNKAPVWNELLDVPIADYETAVLELQVRDWNALQTSKLLGIAKLDLVDLTAANDYSQDFAAYKLQSASQGTLSFSVHFEPKPRTPEEMAILFDKFGPAVVKRADVFLGAMGSTGKAIGGAVGTTGKVVGGAVGSTGKAIGGAVGSTGKALGGAVGSTGKAIGGAVGFTGKAIGGVFGIKKHDEYKFGLKATIAQVQANPALQAIQSKFTLQLQATLDGTPIFVSKLLDQDTLVDVGTLDVASCRGHKSLDIHLLKTSLTPDQLGLPTGTQPMWHVDLSQLVQEKHDLVLTLNGMPIDDSPLTLRLCVEKVPLSEPKAPSNEPSSTSKKLFSFGSKK